MKKLAIIHTSFVSVDALKSLCAEIIPGVEIFNIVDDSLLPEVMKNGKLTPGIIRRICRYATEAESLGADAILNQCSSVGEAVDIARTMLRVPYIKIDEAMSEEAVKIGERISVVATVASTMKPSCSLVEMSAQKAGKEIKLNRCLVDGALDVLMKEGDKEKHNRMVLETIESVKDQSDVIVLAQGSMTVLLPHLGHIKTPILTSPRLGIEKVKKVLGV